MRPAMYIFINRGAGMSPGKIAAQAGHAAVQAYLRSDDRLVQEWYKGGHYTKIVLELRDAEHFHATLLYLRERGFHQCAPIIDEGRTEVAPLTPTAIGVPVVDRDDPHVAATFEVFGLYREPAEPPDGRVRSPGRWFRR